MEKTRIYKRSNHNFIAEFFRFLFSTKPLSREGNLYLNLGLAPLTGLLAVILIGLSVPFEKSLMYAIGVFFCLVVTIGLHLNRRRLHDMNKSCWWLIPLYILNIIPFTTPFALVYMYCKKGVKDNKYGDRYEVGEAIFWKYYDRNKSLWQNIKSFYLSKKGRLNRQGYFWGIYVLILGMYIVHMILSMPMWVVNLAQNLAFWLNGMDKAAELYAYEAHRSLLVNITLMIFMLIQLGVNLLSLFMVLMLKTKRLHDLNCSGWWVVLQVLLAIICPIATIVITIVNMEYYFLVPLAMAAFIILMDLFLLFKKGTKGDNKYGEDLNS